MNRESRIDAYIKRAQPFAQPILEKVRERIHSTLPEVEESIKWGMPAYLLGGKIVVITAAFKAHAALNFWRGQELRGESAAPGAMGQFGKLKSVEELPSDADLERLIREAAALAKNGATPRKTNQVRRPGPDLHPDFARALANAPEAKAALDGFPPSAQRDYLEWIAEAKRESTRRKRIGTAVEWLSAGKRRHWKYESC